MLYDIDFDIAAIAVLLFATVYVFCKKGLARHTNKVYFLILVSCLISSAADICCAYVNTFHDPANHFLQDLFNSLYMSVHILMPWLLVIYLLFELGVITSEGRVQIFLSAIPVLCTLLLIFTNPLTRLAFYYDAEGNYVRGTLFFMFYVTAVSYLVLAVYVAVKHRKNLSRGKRVMLVFLMASSIVPVIFQAFYPYVPIESFCQSLGLLGLLFTLEDKGDIINRVTQVYNRNAFLETAAKHIEKDRGLAIAVKLSNVQYYNSTIGVHYTNELLKEVAGWLDKLKSGLSCYDCGKGDFILLGEPVERDEVTALKREIFKRFNEPFGKRVFQTLLSVQVCVMRIPEDISSMEKLLLIVDRDFGGNHSEDLDVRQVIGGHERRVQVERLINEALESKNFKVYYQPIYETATGKVRSAEALIRLTDPELGYIPPEEFIPIAEQNGTIIDIGAFVFESVCRFYQEKDLKSLGVESLEVNLSVVQCMNRQLTETFLEVTKRYNIPASCVNLEITESAASGSKNALFSTLEDLQGAGFSFSLDDYGIGYSNYSYMFDIPFSIIKLDKSVLWSAIDPKKGPASKNAGILISNTVRMMHEMGYKVLVEGVETAEQKIFLEELGCEYMQGFYFSKPVPQNTFTDFVRVVNS